MLSESPASKIAAGQALINITPVWDSIGGVLIGAAIASQSGITMGYQSAYLLIGCVAIIMTLLTLGLKKQEDQLATMKSNY